MEVRSPEKQTNRNKNMSKNIDVLMDVLSSFNTNKDPRVQSSISYRNQKTSVESTNRPKKIFCWGRRKEPLNDV